MAVRHVEQPESALRAFWREVVTENPLYLREARAVAVPTNYSPEKAEALREKARAARARWDALPQAQKLWRRARPLLITFAVCYALVPLVLEHLSGSSIGPMIGPIISGLFLSAVSTAGAIVAEREKRTWNALLLTQLTPAQILGGKAANVLRVQLFAQAILLSIVLGVVARGDLPALVLLLFPLVLLPSTVLNTLVGIETSLWSTSLKEALSKATRRGAGLGILTLAVGLATTLALFGKLSPALFLLPVFYCVFAVTASVRIWRRMLRDIWRAPKDFSG